MSSTATPPTDEALVADTLRGESQAFADLVQRYQGRLVNYLFRMLRNEADAHDLAQEVFLKIHGALDRFDDRYRFSTWLFRVAQNAAIDRIRKRRLKVVSLQRPASEDHEAGEWEFPSDDPDPYRDARNVERRDAIRSAIANLPGEYRELIEMRHYAEMSYDDIATLKAMPLGTVKNKLFRGRQMLKKTLADYLTD
ncbi:MAG: sigma-70 family RNA polymerase sigma factor [Acidobacteriota bacterium]